MCAPFFQLQFHFQQLQLNSSSSQAPSFSFPLFRSCLLIESTAEQRQRACESVLPGRNRVDRSENRSGRSPTLLLVVSVCSDGSDGQIRVVPLKNADTGSALENGSAKLFCDRSLLDCSPGLLLAFLDADKIWVKQGMKR